MKDREITQLQDDLGSQLKDVKQKSQNERLISDQRLKAYKEKMKDLHLKLKTTKKLLVAKSENARSKMHEPASMFGESAHLLQPSSQMDESTEVTQWKQEAALWKSKYEQSQLALAKSSSVESAKTFGEAELFKVWENVEVLDRSIKKLFESFQKLSQNSSNRSLSDLLNFNSKREYSDIDEEIEAFLQEEAGGLEVTPTRIQMVLKQIQANVNKLISGSSEIYIDQCSNE